MATTDSVRGELAQRQQQSNGNGEVSGTPTLTQFLEQMKGEMARALPAHMSADRMARIVMTLVRRTRNLDKCTLQSFGGAIMTCSQLGLEPGVGGEAWILPYWNNKRGVYEAQLIIGYQGMTKLFWQSPLAKSLDAQAVFQNDDFDFEYGLEPRLVHRPNLNGDRGDPYVYYAVAKTTSGGSAFVVMSKDDIEKIRARSGAKDDGPWQTDYDAMAKKTCLRQLFKLLPKSTALEHALMHDERIRTDKSAEAIDVEPRYIEGAIVDPDGPSDQQPAGEGGAETGEACDVRGCVDPDTHTRATHTAWMKERRQQQQNAGEENQDEGGGDWPEVKEPGSGASQGGGQ